MRISHRATRLALLRGMAATFRTPGVVALFVALVIAGCQDGDLLGAPGTSTAAAPPETPALSQSAFMIASGTITQTEVLSEEVRVAGPNVIVDLTIAGTVDGTLNGSVVDRFTLLLRSDGRFTAQGTTTCECTVEGRSGVLELELTDTGEIIDGTPTFKGRSVIRRGTGGLAGLRGVLQIEGAVDLTTGLSTIGYSGRIHFRP